MNDTVKLEDSKLEAHASVRSNFAVHHLRAAAEAARNSYRIEKDHLAAEHGPWFDDMMVFVPVSIVMAAAALEANANELIQDMLDGFSGLPITRPIELLLKDLAKEQRGNATYKYRQLSLYLNKAPNTDSWQDAELLIAFRNRFMHFRPAWDHEQDIHDGDLVKKLKGRVPIYAPFQSRFQFPYGFLTYGCAKWAVESVLAFSANFSAQLNVKDRFAAEYLDFSLP
jgi:hypothetical protein